MTKLEDRLTRIWDDMAVKTERWHSAHNHKESVAYLTLTANAVLLLQLLSNRHAGPIELMYWLYWSGMIACHAFMRQELVQRRRLAIMIAAADAITSRITYRPESITEEDLKEVPKEHRWPIWQMFLTYILPCFFVNLESLHNISHNTLGRDAVASILERVRTLRVDWWPSLASLAMIAVGFSSVFFGFASLPIE
ncbi:hypothetical protein GR138_12085 [Shinella kummerowiae]|uniref:Uncharacterized protein n=1 Tax=Shinella kummerowiae TaxID=417745 RepID=A0A6N8SBC5_9HYPH|nr:hypothetical protein [Shinella kummerowiae]MXN45933.1 hypothetical protein [Shinella kummerowiae]